MRWRGASCFSVIPEVRYASASVQSVVREKSAISIKRKDELQNNEMTLTLTERMSVLDEGDVRDLGGYENVAVRVHLRVMRQKCIGTENVPVAEESGNVCLGARSECERGGTNDERRHTWSD